MCQGNVPITFSWMWPTSGFTFEVKEMRLREISSQSMLPENSSQRDSWERKYRATFADAENQFREENNKKYRIKEKQNVRL